jgi:hypothetical protein
VSPEMMFPGRHQASSVRLKCDMDRTGLPYRLYLIRGWPQQASRIRSFSEGLLIRRYFDVILPTQSSGGQVRYYVYIT